MLRCLSLFYYWSFVSNFYIFSLKTLRHVNANAAEVIYIYMKISSLENSIFVIGCSLKFKIESVQEKQPKKIEWNLDVKPPRLQQQQKISPNNNNLT